MIRRKMLQIFMQLISLHSIESQKSSVLLHVGSKVTTDNNYSIELFCQCAFVALQWKEMHEPKKVNAEIMLENET